MNSIEQGNIISKIDEQFANIQRIIMTDDNLTSSIKDNIIMLCMSCNDTIVKMITGTGVDEN